MERNLKELFSQVKAIGPYRYLGDIDPSTAEYAGIIAKNKRTDVMGRLMTEGAVMNMLFSQVEAYEDDLSGKVRNRPRELKAKELEICTEIGAYIQENISKRVTILQLGDYFKLSSKKLQQGIRFLFGTTVNEYVANIRLAYAKDLLQNSDGSVSDIAKRCGFKSLSYFSKTFMERYDYLPSDYKRSFQNTNSLFEISYHSVVAEGVTSEQVEEIIEKAVHFNNKNDISGCLIHDENTFFQILEGPKGKVLDFFEKIKSAPRHIRVTPMRRGAKFMRNFNLWSMALVTDRGNLRVTYEDKLESVDLGNSMSSVTTSSEVSDILWRKMRNAVKTSSNIVSTL